MAKKKARRKVRVQRRPAARKASTRRKKASRKKASRRKTSSKKTVLAAPESHCCGYEIARKARGNETLAANEYAETTYMIRLEYGILATISNYAPTITVHYGPGQTVLNRVEPITANVGARPVYALMSGVVFRNCPKRQLVPHPLG